MTVAPSTASTADKGSIVVAGLAAAALLTSWVMTWSDLGTWGALPAYDWPLAVALLGGGAPLVWELLSRASRKEFGADWLAGLSMVTSVLVGEWLAGAIVVLMLSGGRVLESYAVRRASAALELLALRMPQIAHREREGVTTDIRLDEIEIGDRLIVFPLETCPVDGTVVAGHGSMDESYLTGEPYRVDKAPGATVISGAVNGQAAISIRADRLANDSRYAKIMEVMQKAEGERPRMRRLADALGGYFTPLAVAIAIAAWVWSGDSRRFLAVLVTATPCPLLIAIPVAILGGISLCARRGIVIRDPGVLERITTCQVAIFDKTGTLTFGKPTLKDVLPAEGISADRLLAWCASLERYSKHPLAEAVVQAARERGIVPLEAESVSEAPGRGLMGTVEGRQVRVTSRKKLLAESPEAASLAPTTEAGLECVVLVDERYAGTLRFLDEPRPDSRSFVSHLAPSHRFERVLLLSGDRQEEVDRLARRVGIQEALAGQSPEQKLAMIREISKTKATLFLGDGVNDAPALAAATVGIAFGAGHEITAEAAGAAILESSLAKVDELIHIGGRLKRIALESAVLGVGLSALAMLIAAAGWLSPVEGAIFQETIDVLAVFNALRVPLGFDHRSDFDIGARKDEG